MRSCAGGSDMSTLIQSVFTSSNVLATSSATCGQIKRSCPMSRTVVASSQGLSPIPNAPPSSPFVRATSNHKNTTPFSLKPLKMSGNPSAPTNPITTSTTSPNLTPSRTYTTASYETPSSYRAPGFQATRIACTGGLVANASNTASLSAGRKSGGSHLRRYRQVHESSGPSGDLGSTSHSMRLRIGLARRGLTRRSLSSG